MIEMIEQTPILRTAGLGFHIGGARIIDDVSLEVRAGEFMTIIGPNGAGKTSLFNLLSGLYRASSGRIELAGRDITRDPPFQRARAGLVANLPDIEHLPGALRARERAPGRPGARGR